ncbi:hypothetical protein ACA910_015983 [Epithemia clementina (nom. ined.)]
MGMDQQQDHSKEKAAINNLLGCRVRCTLSDGRTATGRFICIDRMKNIILADCVEKRWISSSDYNNNNNNNHPSAFSDMVAAPNVGADNALEVTGTGPEDLLNCSTTPSPSSSPTTTTNNNSHPQSVRKVAIRRLQQAMVPGIQLSKVQITSEIYQKKVLPHLQQQEQTQP